MKVSDAVANAILVPDLSSNVRLCFLLLLLWYKQTFDARDTDEETQKCKR